MSLDTLQDYFPIVLFWGVAFAIGVTVVALSFLIGRQKPYAAKLSAYECGFDPFDDARARFDVRFYLVAILFIIFDIEVVFLFPWAVALEAIGAVGFGAMMVFLGILTVAFIYEWRKGALEWE